MIGTSTSTPPAVIDEIPLRFEGEETVEFEPGPELLEVGHDDVTREVEIPQELLEQMMH